MKSVVQVAVGLAIALAARESLAARYSVPSGSMRPTIEIGDQLCASQLAYGLRVPWTDQYLVTFADPSPGDVVILDSPETGTTLVKRVVAGPGDTVAIENGRVVLNGVPAELTKENATWVESLGGVTHALGDPTETGWGADLPARVLGSDEVLVLGDNRGNSHDGRYFGPVKRGAIHGRVAAICWHGGHPSWTAPRAP